ncbi:diguanylate cyclase [Acetobacterium paludosum]|uniref:Diguanylate cyclase n=1 Tax=Acetobacterium paludosum TaxID=52693 RepID=A0A923HT12_9FIRM|nr:diguanylate cyclase [Acetobacterium paludosum]MBC3886750.1 diguanylate cyclase [Acetobacterium paludosum]
MKNINLSDDKSTKINWSTDVFTIVEWDLTSDSFYSSYSFQKYAMSQIDKNELLKNLDTKSGVHPDDFRTLHDALIRATNNEISEKMILRFKMMDGSYSWTRVSVKFLFNDKKKPKRFILVLMGVNEKVNSDQIPGKAYMSLQVKVNKNLLGIAFYEFDENTRPFVIDDRVRKTSDYPIEAENKDSTTDKIIPSEFNLNKVYNRYPAELYELYLAGKTIEAQINLRGKDELWVWMCYIGNIIDSKGECPLCYVTLSDITEALENNQRHKYWNERYHGLSKNKNGITFHYLPVTDILAYTIRLEGELQNFRIENYLENFPQDTKIHTDSAGPFREVMLNYKTTCNDNTFDFFADFYGTGYHWWHSRHISVADKKGRIYSIIGCADHICAEREEKKIFNATTDTEVVFQRFFMSAALIAMKFDITTGKRFVSENDVVPSEVPADITISDFLLHLKELVHPEDKRSIEKHLNLDSIKRNLNSTNRKISFDCRARSLSGKFDGYHWVGVNYMTIAAVNCDEHSIVFIYVVDINEKKKSQLRLMEQVKRDTLTGLLNRTAFFEFFTEVIQRANIEENKNKKAAAFVMINVDNMKQINENLGHVIGDKLIENMAVTLRAIHKESAARLYADKFALCIYDISDQSVFQEQMRIVSNALTQKIDGEIAFTVSMGIAIYPTDAEVVSDLYEKADKALSKAIKDNGQQYVFYSPEMDRKEQSDKLTITSCDVITKQKQRVFIRAFGYFELFVDGQAVPINLEKAKELLALLIDRRGGFLSANEAISYLWEDEPADKTTKSRYRKVAMRLNNILSKYNVEDIIENKHGLRRIVTEKINCDYYEYLSEYPVSQHLFMGAYMSNYSWGETTLSMLEQMTIKPE